MIMMMTTEECHPEEMRAFATRRPADEGPTHYSPRRLAQTVVFILLTRVPRPSSLGRGLPSAERIRDFPTLTSKSTTLGWAACLFLIKPKSHTN
jgi:hypothetical protein